MKIAKFDAPVLGENIRDLYSKIYGDAGTRFVEILSTSPDEIAVISRLIAYLSEDKSNKTTVPSLSRRELNERPTE